MNVDATNPPEVPADSRPFWQAGPCPAWCAYPGCHRGGEAPADRTHFGETFDVPMTTEESLESREYHEAVRAHRNGDRTAEPERQFKRFEERTTAQWWRTYLTQHYREAEPRVWLGLDESSTGGHLTLDEAEELGGQLVDLARRARAAVLGQSPLPVAPNAERMEIGA